MTKTHTPDHNNNQLDRVLNAFRNATPPTGMDRRILNLLEAQSSLKGVIPSEAKRSRGTGSPASLLAGVGGTPTFRNARTATLLRWTPTAAIAALTVAALITLTSHRRTTQPTTATTHNTAIPAQRINTTTTIAHTTPPIHVKPIQPQHTETTPLTEEAQLSHPAPPIPITDQEHILLRYARGGRTDDLAQISNDRKAAKEQQDAAEFQAFFKPPIKIGESE